MNSNVINIRGIDRTLFHTTSFSDLESFLDPSRKFSYDVESNATRLYSVEYKLVGFSVAHEKTQGMYICYESLDKSMSPEDKRLVDEYMKEVLMSSNYIVHNMQHERAAMKTYYGIEVPYENIDDTLFMSRLLRGGQVGSGLKYQAQLNLGYPDWDTDLGLYMSNALSLVRTWMKDGTKVVNPNDESEPTLIMRELLTEYGYDNPNELLQLLCDKAWSIYKSYDRLPSLLSYGLIPYNLIVKYGAMDALATIELNDFYHDEMIRQSELPSLDLLKGYEVLRKQAYAGYILERNGAFFDDDFVEEVFQDAKYRSVEALKRMILNPIVRPFMEKKAYDMYLLDVLVRHPEYGILDGIMVTINDKGQYLVKVNGKRASRDRAWSIQPTQAIMDECINLMTDAVNSAKTYDDLKPLYNPKSVTDNKGIIDCLLKNEDFFYAGLARNLASQLIYKGLYDISLSEEIEQLDIITKHKCIDIYKGTLDIMKIVEAREKFWYKEASYRAGELVDRLFEVADKVGLTESQISYLLSKQGSDYNIINENCFNKAIKIGIYSMMTEYDHAIMELSSVLYDRELHRKYLNEGTPEYNTEYETFKSLVKMGLTLDDDGNLLSYDPAIHSEIIIKYFNSEKENAQDSLSRGDLGEFVKKLNVAGVNTDNEEMRTTNDYMRYLVDMTIYVRLVKLITAYIEGDKLGRPSVSVVSKDDIKKGITTNRLRSYYDSPKRSDETTLMNSSFSVCTANTLRWQAGLHTLQWRSVSKQFYTSRYKGGTILCPDYSQNEVRCLASTSQCKLLLQAFLDGEDPHASSAALIFNKPKEEINPSERRFAKSATFSILYGASIQGFAENYCYGDVSKAEEIIGNYYKAYPEIKNWIDSMHESAKTKGFVPTLMNAKIVIHPNKETGKYGSKQLRDAQNAPIQSASSAICGCVLFEMCRWIEENKLLTKPFLFVHDSLEFDCPPYEFIKVVNKLGIALNEIPIRDYKTPVHAELTLGKSLGHECETEIIVDGDPETATECTLVLSGLQNEIYETIENWKSVYDIEILDEYHIKKDDEGNKVKVPGYEEKPITYYDVYSNSRPFTTKVGTSEFEGTCELHLKYKMDQYKEYLRTNEAM